MTGLKVVSHRGLELGTRVFDRTNTRKVLLNKQVTLDLLRIEVSRLYAELVVASGQGNFSCVARNLRYTASVE